MHKVHSYPAKFPAFIASKAFEYAKDEGVDVKKVADIFCGCGTVALEARINGMDFWGCDINPVATLIAKAKSHTYILERLNLHYDGIMQKFEAMEIASSLYDDANERLRYWFVEANYLELYKIKTCIDEEFDKNRRSKYKDAFLCVFSSILKASSKWLSKSIKPQVDPDKTVNDPINLFRIHFGLFFKSVEELKDESESKMRIVEKNFLNVRGRIPKVDLIVTSPPYVTSYEYADLHQLSSLWLGYTEDYKELRKGTIGSSYGNDELSADDENLNIIGKSIVSQLKDRKGNTKEVKSVVRYYLDMQKAVSICYRMVNDNGMVFFVVGDTEYKGVKILNSQHLVQCLMDSGFQDIKATRRMISKKILTPYRDENGKFSSDKDKREVYHEEFIITARKYGN